MAKRLTDLQPFIKGCDTKMLDKLFKKVIEHNRILTFKKVTGDDTEKREMVANWTQIHKLANYRFKKEDIK